MIYSNTKDINVVSIYEKTKWKYQWNSNYIVEIVKYEYWDKLSKYDDIPGLAVHLKEEPFIVSYGVNVSKIFLSYYFLINEILISIFILNI